MMGNGTGMNGPKVAAVMHRKEQKARLGNERGGWDYGNCRVKLVGGIVGNKKQHRVHITGYNSP